MRRILLILALLLLAPLAVEARDFGYQDCTVGDGSCQVGDPYTSNDANRLRDALNTNAIFYSEDYQTASTTFGIQEAHAACVAGGKGGLVMVPDEQVTINCAGVTGQCLDLAAIDRGGIPYGSCELAGYGASQQDQLASDIKAGSGVRFSNLNQMVADGNGDRTAIRIRGHGQVIRDMNIAAMTNTGAANQPFYGILASSDDPNIASGSLTDLRLDRVVLTGNAASEDAGGAGFGIGLRFVMKSVFNDVSVKSFEENIVLEYAGSNDLANNGNVWTGLSARSAAVTNFRIQQGRACRSLTLVGGVNEDAPYGLIADAGSRCNIADLGVHWENSLVDVEIRSDEATYRGWAPTFSDSGAKNFNITRTVAQAAGTGPDMVYGGRFDNGVDYSVPGTMIRIIDAHDYQTADMTNATGTAYHAASDCPNEAPTTGVAGDLCVQDSDSVLFRCDPDTDGICNTPGEWVGFPVAGGSPGGSGTEIQHRAGVSSFGAVAGSSWDGSLLTVPSLAITPGASGTNAWTFDPNATTEPAAPPAASNQVKLYTKADGELYKRDEGDTPTGKKLQTEDDLATHVANTDAHHSETHTVASHSDTSATGPELDELTDGSETTLHSHAGGGGGDVSEIGSGTQAVNPVSLAAGACDASITTAAAGVATTDVVKFSPAQQLSGSVGWGATDAIRMDVYVSAAGTITWETCNPTDGVVDAVSRNFNWQVHR